MSTPTRHLFTKIAAVKKTLHLNLATCLAVMLHYQSLQLLFLFLGTDLNNEVIQDKPSLLTETVKLQSEKGK